ncbi:LacI family DNA-binding transcriptional regulator [Saccharopolyspora sp. WRP15-2]|uniref:LacI family DNA-binding transcriptional regulator n=1 Tax=Saccharopolyspora oryzae TaxID=2997343 RepID=A0ABT4UWL0_9PSEU|nr:LacI family DNA-binding transcriptional regulator [Saccharopolyspora oryzae]MDA3626112.1 LacI family DNA-binding transcriptional regulator [Saccharopolyspora oryzae]
MRTNESGRPTSKDVARLAGVSHTAVSFMFNGRAEGNLSAATQERIRSAAAELGYRPDAVARGLRRRRTAMLGLVTDRIASSPFAGELLTGAMETAWEAGHLVLTVDSGGDPEKEAAAVDGLLDRRVDGIIYAAMSPYLASLPPGLNGTPVVLANCLPADGHHAAVVPDDRAGGAVATRALLAAGHRRIAVVGGIDDIATGERLAGHRDALAAAGVAEGPVLHCGGEISHGHAAALELLARDDRPTGIICYNDRVATGVLHAAARLALDVPGDLSIVGYDDQRFLAEHTTPPLTTVALPHHAMGKTAARLLLDAIGSGAAPKPEVLRLPCPLVERGSVARPG